MTPLVKGAPRIRRLASRTALLAALIACLIGGTSTAALALWSASSSNATSALIGKLSGTVGGTTAMTTTFSASTTSSTYPLTLTNTAAIAATYSTSAAVTTGVTLAQNIRVDAWPVGSASVCAASSSVGAGSVTGTWAAMPNLTGSLSGNQAAVWCLRSTPQAGAPASTTTNPVVSLTLATGSWRATNAGQVFYLNSAASAPAATATCTDQTGGNNVVIAWDASNRPSETWYDLEIGGVRVGDPSQGYSARSTLSASRVPASVAADGPARVDVVVLDAAQNATSTIQASSPVTFASPETGRTVRCGA